MRRQARATERRLVAELALFLNVEAVAHLEFVEPAFARNEIPAGAHFDRHLFDLTRSHHASFLGLTLVPLVEGAFHLRVFGLPASALLSFAADLYPALERL